ncbi:MAG: type II toxin-antitoxin system death-on-curing family toxin [Pseudomonadota bacterium]
MNFALLSADVVRLIHDDVLNPGEVQGEAGNKSLEGALARVDNRVVYGMVSDGFDLAAAYAVSVAMGHVFNDGNKRTAFRTMNAALNFNGVTLSWATEEVGQKIISVAQGHVDEEELAALLREKARVQPGQ